MRAQFTPLFSILGPLASVANATPTLLAERVDCSEGDGSSRHYVMVRPHEYTWLVGLDKLGADNWQVRGNTDVTVGPWYFTPKEPKPYTVEHFKLGMSQRHEGESWDELMGKTGNMDETAAVYEARPADGKCWVEAPYGISLGCVSISIYDEASGNQIISPSQADVTTRCEKRDKAWRADGEMAPLVPVPMPGDSN